MIGAGFNPGFGVYIHWPFCAAKCPYCDFNSHVRHQPVDQQRFVKAFEREMAAMRARTGQREVRSIFIGGGTPSLMEPATVGAILMSWRGTGQCLAGIEVTLEAILLGRGRPPAATVPPASTACRWACRRERPDLRFWAAA
jgi:coproporphyrinogen III oxidase-like Fe-S oxidoreductase